MDKWSVIQAQLRYPDFIQTVNYLLSVLLTASNWSLAWHGTLGQSGWGADCGKTKPSGTTGKGLDIRKRVGYFLVLGNRRQTMVSSAGTVSRRRPPSRRRWEWIVPRPAISWILQNIITSVTQLGKIQTYFTFLWTFLHRSKIDFIQEQRLKILISIIISKSIK